MPVAASLSLAELTEVLERMGFYPREDDPTVFERPSDHLMLFPDVRNGRVTLRDILDSIEEWQGTENLTDRFMEIFNELGGLDFGLPTDDAL